MKAVQLRHRARYFAFAAEDFDELQRRLEAKFANLKIIDNEYGIPAHPEGRKRKGETDPRVLIYLERLSGRDPYVKNVWIEPPGWKPLWRGPDKYGSFGLVNGPPRRVRFLAGGIPPVGSGLVFHTGRVTGSYVPDDREAKAFIEAVIRIVGKLGSSVVKILDRDSRAVTHPAARTGISIGPAVMRWLAEDERRTVDERYRPPDL